MHTVVECFGLQLHGDRLVGRRMEVPLSEHPDRDASRAIGLADSDWDGIAVLHSTSWRWDEEPGRLVLTYLCSPDPVPGDADGELIVVTVPDEPLGTASRPSPAAHSHGTVLHHGVGHLAWLAEHEPHLVVSSRRASPRLWEAILAAGRSRAGQLVRPHRLEHVGPAMEPVVRG